MSDSRPDPPPGAGRFRLAAGGLALAAFALCLWITTTQHLSLNTYLADVGSFHFVVGGPLHGEWLRTPVAWNAGANYFGIHFQPALLAITPFYLLWSSPLVMLAFFCAGIGLAAYPLALLGRGAGLAAEAALALGGLWAANHFVGSLHLANHPESLAMPFWFGAFLAVERRRPVAYGLCLLAAFSVKQDMAFYGLLYAGALALDRDTRRWAAATAAGSVAWGLLAAGVMAAGGAAEMAALGASPANRYASFGDTPLAILAGMASSPGVLAERLLAPSVFWLYASVLFLPLLDWRRAWLPYAALLPLLLSDEPFLRDLLYYYSYPALPFLFLGAARGGGALLRFAESKGRRTLAERGLAAALVLAAAAQLAIPTRTDGWMRRPFAVDGRWRTLAALFEFIPPDAPLAVQFDIYPHAPLRPFLVSFREEFLGEVDFVVLNERRFPADLADKGDEFQRAMEELESGRWEVVVREDGFVVLGRRGR